MVKSTQSVSGVDVATGSLTLRESDVRSSKSGMGFARVYNPNSLAKTSMKNWSHGYENAMDSLRDYNEITTKSTLYKKRDKSCTDGWDELKDSLYGGVMSGATASYDNSKKLCYIQEDGETLAIYPTLSNNNEDFSQFHILTKATGEAYLFIKNGNSYSESTNLAIKLSREGNHWHIKNPNNSLDIYGHKGRLESTSRNGQTTNFYYDSVNRLDKIVDAFGKEIELYYQGDVLSKVKSYDATEVNYAYVNNRLNSITYPDGSTKSYNYSGDKVTQVLNSSNIATTTFAYDSNGKVTTLAGVNGSNLKSFDYNSDSTKVTQNGVERDYFYSIIKSLPKVHKVQDDEGVSTTTYDVNAYPVTRTNKLNVKTNTLYDSNGLLTEKTTNYQTGDAKTTKTAYFEDIRKAQKMASEGRVTFYLYNTLGQMSSKTVATLTGENPSTDEMFAYTLATIGAKPNVLLQTTAYTYNDKGLQTGSTQANGGTISNEYDAEGNRKKSTNALGFVSETTAFDSAGRPLSQKDINGKISTTTYDIMGRVLTSTSNGQTTTHLYNSDGKNIKTTYPDGLVEEKSYNDSGNIVESWNNQGDRTKNYYNANNQLIKTEIFKDGTLVNKSETLYDNKNRVIATKDSYGNQTTYTYNSLGQKIATTDALGRVTQYQYNTKGQLDKEINPESGETTYSYNADGQKVAVITPNGAVFGFAYDLLQRVIVKHNPDRGTSTYSYDISGNILTETNAKGEIKTYAYDIANRKTGTSYEDSTLNETYEYDQGANANGRLTTINDSSGSLTFTYDAHDHIATKTQTIGSQSFTTTYAYNSNGKLTSKTYPSGKNIGYSYDAQGELTAISIDGNPYITDIETNQNGLVSYTYANGDTHNRVYGTNGRVTALIYPNYTENVTYNVVSNITSIQADAVNKTFGFDNLDRLTSYLNGTTNAFQNFTYDGNGNRLTQNQEINKTQDYSYLSESNILESIKHYEQTTLTKDINYTYDATGNIVADGRHFYSYDSRNRLVAIDGNVTYQYNYDNRRVSKTVNSTTTYFIYDGHMLIGEYDQNGDIIKEYIYLHSTPIATTTATEIYRVYSDHLNTPRRVAQDDGTIVWKWESSPFGETQPTGTLNFNLRFPGQYYDEETGTHYNINRDYNPITGRYIQSDPIGFDGGVNTFGYVSGNPLTNFDPLGLTTYIISNLNGGYLFGWGGTHTGLVVLNSYGHIERSFLYDPSGSYYYINAWGDYERGSGGIQYWDSDAPIDLSDYYAFQTEDGSDVKIYSFNTTESDEAILLSESEKWGGGSGFDCTDSISYILSQTNKFSNIEQVTFPVSLADQLEDM